MKLEYLKQICRTASADVAISEAREDAVFQNSIFELSALSKTYADRSVL